MKRKACAFLVATQIVHLVDPNLSETRKKVPLNGDSSVGRSIKMRSAVSIIYCKAG